MSGVDFKRIYIDVSVSLPNFDEPEQLPLISATLNENHEALASFVQSLDVNQRGAYVFLFS